MTHKAVFLDRDDTLIRGYKGRPANTVEEVELLPGVAKGIQKLRALGYTLIVVTNQGGVGLGYVTTQVVHQMHDRVNDLLMMANNSGIDAFYFCPHRPDEGCPCRKPKAGMILQAEKDLGVDLSKSFIIGDDPRDMGAGAAAGLRKKILVADKFVSSSSADVQVPDLVEAARYVEYLENIN